ncbi:hypothetical protein [Vreelandella venusta]|uniref:Uncharacterized protein n=1 Tax=Vreelandella venusta TaxID=44935 RepID=A0ABX2B9F8_9GAMM|nr:hypothetical protein [Halomonas venusta]AZM96059.1 hypothetical protein EI420_10355 [Halomonas venusta]NPT30652.1 hypothetical protein [Halomonas venusta]
MIDAILYLSSDAQLPESLTDEGGNPLLSDPRTVNANGDCLHYVRLLPELLNEWRSHVTVLAEAPYAGVGTADRLYQQIQNDPNALALYESVYDTSPREVDDGEGGKATYTPPFAFGMLAESQLPVPESVSSRQGMEQLIRSGLDEQVDSAINGITDPVERKLVRNWLDKAGIWERDNPQLLAIGNALALSEQDVDSLFIQAARL